MLFPAFISNTYMLTPLPHDVYFGISCRWRGETFFILPAEGIGMITAISLPVKLSVRTCRYCREFQFVEHMYILAGCYFCSIFFICSICHTHAPGVNCVCPARSVVICLPPYWVSLTVEQISLPASLCLLLYWQRVLLSHAKCLSAAPEREFSIYLKGFGIISTS